MVVHETVPMLSLPRSVYPFFRRLDSFFFPPPWESYFACGGPFNAALIKWVILFRASVPKCFSLGRRMAGVFLPLFFARRSQSSFVISTYCPFPMEKLSRADHRGRSAISLGGYSIRTSLPLSILVWTGSSMPFCLGFFRPICVSPQPENLEKYRLRRFFRFFFRVGRRALFVCPAAGRRTPPPPP